MNRLAITTIFFLHGLLVGTWAARIPGVVTKLDLSEGELGILLLVGTGAGVACLPFAGWLGSLWLTPAAVTSMGIASSGAIVLMGAGTTFLAVAVGLSLFGITLTLLDVAMNSRGVALEKRRGDLILSSLHAAWSFGGLGGAFGASLATQAGIDIALHFALIAGASALAIGLLHRHIPAPQAAREGERKSIRALPRSFVILAVLVFCGLFAESAAHDWSALFVKLETRTTASLAAWGFGAFSLSMGISRLFGDAVVHRLGTMRTMLVGGFMSCAGFLAGATAEQAGVAIACFAIAGLGMGNVVPVAFRAVGSITGVPPAAGIAALSTIGYAAFLVAPATIGLFSEATSLRVSFTGVAALQLVMVALIFFAPGLRDSGDASGREPLGPHV